MGIDAGAGNKLQGVQTGSEPFFVWREQTWHTDCQPSVLGAWLCGAGGLPDDGQGCRPDCLQELIP